MEAPESAHPLEFRLLAKLHDRLFLQLERERKFLHTQKLNELVAAHDVVLLDATLLRECLKFNEAERLHGGPCPKFRAGIKSVFMTMDLAIFIGSTLAALLMVGYTYLESRLDDLKANWIQYRCNPLYMPFAGLVGVDVAGNFTRCTMKSFQDYLGFILDPIQHLFATFLGMFASIANSLQGLRAAFNGIRNGFLAVVTQIYGKLNNTMTAMQYLMIRIRTVMMRTMGIFAIMVNMFKVGTKSGESVINGPVGQTLSFLCFHPDTPVVLEGGLSIRMGVVSPGDRLADGSRVVATYLLNGYGEVLYDYRGVLLTGSHRLLDGRRIDECPDAIRTEEVTPFLACLETDTGQIRIGDIVFRDFELAHWFSDESHHIATLGEEVVGQVVGLRRSQTTWEVLAVEM